MVLLSACTPKLEVPKQDETYGAGFVIIDEPSWADNYDTPYPFTVPSGEISCEAHASSGREVYFEPNGFTDESYIGTPLNQTAVNSLEQASMSVNVPYSIKQDADLSNAIKVGLQVCDEMRDWLKSSEV